MESARRLSYAILATLHAEDQNWQRNGEAWLLRSLGGRARHIVDVGANRGEWASMALSVCPSATLHCFEIASSTRELLQERLGTCPRVRIANFGLLDRRGDISFKHYAVHDKWSSVVDFPHPEAYVWHSETVDTGDAYVEGERLDHIDLLKIDTEGSDLRVLRGFSKSLSAGRISVVQFEYGYAGILSGALLYDFYTFLTPLGFVIGRLFPRRVAFRSYQLKDERFFGPNYVGVRADHPELIQLLSSGRSRPGLPG